MNLMKKNLQRVLLTLAMALAMLSVPGIIVQAATGTDTSKIVIVHTNDAHCSINTVNDSSKNSYTLGYACVAGVAREEESIYKNVTIADAGDHIQGESVGVLTQGKAIIDIMNAVGYDVSTLGNHEFDYGLDTLFSLTKQANYPYVSCNFKSVSSGQSVYKPYIIENYEIDDDNSHDIQIAYVGVTTPETITRSAATIFQDSAGNPLYTFCQDSTGEALYNCIQASVDDARSEGADYVVIVGHLGQESITPIWRSDTIVKNTSGIDAVIDGHSHEKYIQHVNNKNGESVLIAQTGALLNSVGIMTLDVETGTFSEEIKDAPLVTADENVQKVVSDVNEELKDILTQKIATSTVNLYTMEDDNWTWVVRSKETNMGDLTTDALKTVLNTDAAMIGGGSVRANIPAGPISYQNLLSIFPWGNDTCIIKATGQQILDALEMGASKYPDDSGAFMQVSGITYDINTSVTPSNVVTNEDHAFVKVNGRYRVENVRINGQPIDLNKTYTVAGIVYTLLNQGDGLSMFKGCEAVVTTGPKDIEVLKTYLQNYLNGVIGTQYNGRYGQGRIRFITDESDQPEASTEKKADSTTSTEEKTVATAKKQILITKGSAKKNSISLKWNSVKGASYYKVYFSRCGAAWKQVAKTTKTSYTKKSLKKGKGYRAYVAAYDSKGKLLSKSPSIHVTTLKGPRANATKVKVNKAKVSLAVGKKSSVKGNVVKKDAKKTLFGRDHVATIRYYSSDKAVASVSSSGKITAKKAGSCYVYAVAPSGAYAKTAVTVK